MSDQALLSELCGICYTQKPKYRCPGCKTQTCSLPCYKRHQQRASCNGKRDPAVFVKRSQLATPAGIDQDYNYLKSVERSIDHAARETLDRGVGSKTNAKGSERGLHPESLLQRYLVSNRIRVERAPKGMSRQKTNQTRFTKRQNILWTVEWVHADGLQTVQADCSASSSVGDCYELMLLQKRNASMRSGAVDGSTTKRKRADFSDDPANKTSKPRRNPVNQVKQPDVAANANDSDQLQSSIQLSNGAEVQLPEATRQPKMEVGSELIAHAEPPTETVQPATQSFYLLKPGTSSPCKVLIPLDAQATLTESLQGRTVLEYPTIYILPSSAEALPSAYLLERDYNKIRQGEEDELNDAIKQAGAAARTHDIRQHEPVAPSASIDPQRILDMLKRDITR